MGTLCTLPPEEPSIFAPAATLSTRMLSGFPHSPIPATLEFQDEDLGLWRSVLCLENVAAFRESQLSTLTYASFRSGSRNNKAFLMN